MLQTTSDVNTLYFINGFMMESLFLFEAKWGKTRSSQSVSVWCVTKKGTPYKFLSLSGGLVVLFPECVRDHLSCVSFWWFHFDGLFSLLWDWHTLLTSLIFHEIQIKEEKGEYGSRQSVCLPRNEYFLGVIVPVWGILLMGGSGNPSNMLHHSSSWVCSQNVLGNTWFPCLRHIIRWHTISLIFHEMQIKEVLEAGLLPRN